MKIHPHPHGRSLDNRTISRCLYLGRVASLCGLIGGVIVALASVARAETTSLMTLELKEVGSVSGQLLGSAAAPRLWGNVDSPRLYAVSGEEEEERGDQFKPYLEELFLGFVIYPQEQGEVQLTWGYFDHVETNHDSQFLFEVEYGITDTLQIGLALPVDFLPEESYDGIRNIGVELYWNFYNNPHTGRGYGVGFEVGLPSDAPAGESRSYI